MKRTRLLNVLMLWSICSLAAAAPARAQQNWTRMSPAGAGFSVESPVAADPTDKKGFYLYAYEGWSLAVMVFTHTDEERRRFAGDSKALKRELKTAKEEVLSGWDAVKSSGSSSEKLDGYPAVRFRFEDGDESKGYSMVVLTSDRRYEIVAYGRKDRLDEHAKRFIDSFRLVTPATGSR